MDSGNGSQCRRHAAYCTATCLPAEAVTTHRDTFVPMCRQVFGLADVDLAIRLLVPASQSWTTSACGDVRFRFTAAGQFRNYTGFPFKPDRRSRLDGHRQTQHIGCPGRGQPNKLWTSRGISGAARDAAGLRRTLKIVADVAMSTGSLWRAGDTVGSMLEAQEYLARCHGSRALVCTSRSWIECHG